MKILLIYPTTKRLFRQPSLGIMSIGSVLRDAGHQVDIIEGEGEMLELQVLTRKSFGRDIVGITCMTPMYKDTLRVAEYAKKMLENPLVIIGGAHATIMPETLLSSEAIDVCVVGEGERTILQLVSAYENGTPIQDVCGIAYRDSLGLVKFTDPMPLIQDLDTIPFPARDLVDKKYFKKRATIMASRGCKFNCSFCQPTLRKLFGARTRRRSAENVVKEMDSVNAEFGVDCFEFFDDTFTEDRGFVMKLCKLLESREYKWEILTRVDVVDRELLEIMDNAGMVKISFGVESGSQEILNRLRKGIKVEQSIEAFDICSELGIESHALFMIGSPGETRESIEATRRLIKVIEPYTIYFSITTPLPHTGLHDDCVKNDTLAGDWQDIDYYRNPTMKLKNLTNEEIIQARDKILREFYIKKILTDPLWAIRYLRERGWEYVKTVASHLFAE